MRPCFLYRVAAVPLLLVASSTAPSFADDASGEKATTIVTIAAPEESPAIVKVAEAADEPLNLEILAAPLQLLFGFGGRENGFGEVRMLGVPMAAGDAVAQNDAMVQQFLQQFRPFLVEELSFTRMACSDLSPERRPKIKAAGEATLKQAAKEMADIQNRQNQGRMGVQASMMPEPRKMIREAIAKALQETLNEDQMVRYTREANDRKSHRKKAAILSVVSRLDGCLFLTGKQRDKIVDEISANWQDKWEQWLMMSSYGDQYFPVMPDEYVAPHLDANQKVVWQGLQKIDFGIWWGGGNQNQANDGWWGEDAANAEAPVNGAVIFNFQGIGVE